MIRICKNKLKFKYVFLTVITALFFVIGCILINNSRLDVYKDSSFIVSHTIEYNQLDRYVNYEVNDNQFKQIDEDPQIYLSGFMLDLESIKITFQEPLKEDISIQVYYLDDSNFFEKRSIVKIGHMGETVIFIDTDTVVDSQILRIDIDGDFCLDKIDLSSNDYQKEYMGKTKVAGSIYLLCIVISIILAYIATKVTCNIILFLKKICLGKTLFINVLASLFVFTISICFVFIIDNHIYLSIILTTMGIGYVFFLCRNKVYENLHFIMSAAILLIGIFVIYTMPCATLISPDDEIHYKNSVCLSHLFDYGVTEADEYIYNRKVTLTNNSYDYNELMNKLQQMYEQGVSTDNCKMTVDLYKRISYIPSAVGMFVARGLNLSFKSIFYSGKFGNLLFYAIMIYLSIKKIKSGKLLLALFSIVPANIFLASAYSYDIWLTGLTILAFSYIIGNIQESTNGKKISKKDMIIILSAFILGLSPKAIYFPIILSVFVMSKQVFASRKTRKIFFLCSLLAMLIVLMTFLLPFIIKGPGEGDIRGGSNVNSTEQVHYILSNPVEYARTLIHNMKSYLSINNQIKTLGDYAFIGSTLHFPLILILLTIVSISDRNKYDVNSNKKSIKMWIMLIFFSSVILVSTALYVSFSPVGSLNIYGCQFRYLLPLIFPLLYFVANINMEMKSNINLYSVILSLIMIWIIYDDAWNLWIKNIYFC